MAEIAREELFGGWLVVLGGNSPDTERGELFGGWVVVLGGDCPDKEIERIAKL